MLCWAVAPLTMLAGCGDTSDKGKADRAAENPETIMGQIHEAENAQMDALGRHDIKGATDIYTPDARFYPPVGPVAVGRDAITRHFTKNIGDDAYQVLVDANSRQNWVAASGDLVATGFTARVSLTVNGKVVTTPFVNRTIWVRQPDGKWQIDSEVNAVIPEPAK